MPRRDPPTSPRRVTGKARDLRALELRMQGHTYQGIANELGTSRSTAFRCLSRALARLEDETRGTAGEFVQIEMERLDALQCAIWDDAINGNLSAVDRVLRVMERRAKLLGLDAPNRAEISGPHGSPMEIKPAPRPSLKDLTDEQLAVLRQIKSMEAKANDADNAPARPEGH